MAAIGWLDAAPCMSEAGEDCDEYCDRGADDAGYGFPSGLVSGSPPPLGNSWRGATIAMSSCESTGQLIPAAAVLHEIAGLE